MKNTLYPESGVLRREKAVKRRQKTAEELNSLKTHLTADNGDNASHSDTYLTAFTKGLAHDDQGLI